VGVRFYLGVSRNLGKTSCMETNVSTALWSFLNLTPFDTNWRKGGGATPLAIQGLFFRDAIFDPHRPYHMQLLRRACCSGINWQRGVVAEGGLQAFDGASLVAGWVAADADGANHLSVHNDRDAAWNLE